MLNFHTGPYAKVTRRLPHTYKPRCIILIADYEDGCLDDPVYRLRETLRAESKSDSQNTEMYEITHEDDGKLFLMFRLGQMMVSTDVTE